MRISFSSTSMTSRSPPISQTTKGVRGRRRDTSSLLTAWSIAVLPLISSTCRQAAINKTKNSQQNMPAVESGLTDTLLTGSKGSPAYVLSWPLNLIPPFFLLFLYFSPENLASRYESAAGNGGRYLPLIQNRFRLLADPSRKCSTRSRLGGVRNRPYV